MTTRLRSYLRLHSSHRSYITKASRCHTATSLETLIPTYTLEATHVLARGPTIASKGLQTGQKQQRDGIVVDVEMVPPVSGKLSAQHVATKNAVAANTNRRDPRPSPVPRVTIRVTHIGYLQPTTR